MSNLSFPDKPRAPDPNRYGIYRITGTPQNVEALLIAQEMGVGHLADKLWNMDVKSDWMTKSPFTTSEIATQGMTFVLSQMNKDLVTAIITNSIHLCFDPAVNKSFELLNHHRLILSGPAALERPVIYALALCGPLGQTPTRAQLERMLDVIGDYAKTTWRGLEWDDADKAAHTIDHISPKGRNWAAGTKGRAAEEWKQGDPHPRRYACKPNQKQLCNDFIGKMYQRLMTIPTHKLNDPLRFSLTYIGYTRQEEVRRDQHYSHAGAATSLKFLLEAVSTHLFPGDSFLMRYCPLIPVIDADHARIAEHGLSLLAESYSIWGNLNGALAGAPKKMIETGATDVTWGNAADAVLKQGVLAKNIKKLEVQVAADAFWIKYNQKGSELNMLNKATEDLRDADSKLSISLDRIGPKYDEWSKLKKEEAEMISDTLGNQASINRLDALSQWLKAERDDGKQ